ncbi:portal protein [Mesorhizobium sp. M1252]|uniref:portal protein n=1 Tax=Mesorhizobium sp. M1252 TaxID=2957073 RepID=UPI00333AA285
MSNIDPTNNGVVADEDSIASMYSRLESERQNFLDRARENAKLTIPSLMPPEGYAPGQRLSTPFQSIGSHGVNTLTAKLVMTILPANSPMFRVSVTDQVVEELSASTMLRSGVEKKLNEIERSVMDEIEGLGIRAALVEAIKQLIVAGNVLLYLPPKGNLRVYKLDRYVVQRDYEGNVLRVIIKETVAKEVLPEDVRALVFKPSDNLPSDAAKVEEKEVDIYTVFERDGERMHTFQTIKGVKLPKSRGSWKADKTPIMPLRWSYLHDEPYGRAYIDEYIGDLTGVESLSRSIREGAAAAAKMNPMVNPVGLTRAQDIANAENLEVISGRADDVSMLQFDKQADFQVAQTVLQDLISRLTHAFMMNSSVQRQAERVTAEEIRAMVSDIDTVLGGVYSLLAQELQLPLVIRIMDRMVREKKIPNLETIKGADGKPVAKPKIVTGIEALGRGQDFNKYMTAMTQIIVPLKNELGPEMNLRDFAERAFVSLSIDIDGLFKTPEQKAQQAQQMQGAQQGQMAQQMMVDAVKGATPHLAKAAVEGIANQDQGPE